MNNILDNIKVILCNTSHSGNIGSTARAMKTMGLSKLVLVNPKAIIDEHAYALASSASDVLDNVTICSSLDEALNDTTLSIGLSARMREFKHKIYTPREIAPLILEQAQLAHQVALVFGSETNGLTIEEIEKCNCKLTIPANLIYSSLNLSQAVQVICYEIYSQYNPNVHHLESQLNPATFEDNQRILDNFSQIFKQISYAPKGNHTLLMRRVQNILHKAKLEKEEAELIMGICKKISKNLDQ